MHYRTALLAGALLVGATSAYSWERDPALIEKIDVGGKGLGTFDISFVDAKISLYVLSDRTNASVDFVNTQDNSFIGRSPQIFAGQQFKADGKTADNTISGPDGVTIIGHTEVWAGDGDSTIKVLDANTMQLIQTIPVPDPNGGSNRRVDEMAWDSANHILVAANNANVPPFLTFVNTDTKQILGQLVFDGTNNTPDATNTGIEQPAWSPRTGLFYVSVPQIVQGTDPVSMSKGGVSVVDPLTMKVLTTYEVDNCSPAGLTIGPKNHALIGCSGQFGAPPTTTSQVIDVTNGDVVAVVPLGGNDEVWFDAGTHHYYLAARSNLDANGNPDPVLGSVDATDNTVDGTASTSTTAHSVAADKFEHHIYVPIGYVPPGSAEGTDPTNPCPDHGCIAVYRPAEGVILAKREER